MKGDFYEYYLSISLEYIDLYPPTPSPLRKHTLHSISISHIQLQQIDSCSLLFRLITLCSGKVKLVNSVNPLVFRFTFTIID